MFRGWVIVLVVAAFTLRTIFIFQEAISFHYDMARDAYIAKQIWQDREWKILGPPTSTPGLYHGVFYYYLIAPFYLLGNGDPKIPAVFFALINSLVLIPLMILAKDLFKNYKWAILAGILYVVSFEATQYASWLSNPSPAILTVALYFLFLRLWQKGKIWGLYFATLVAALSVQFQFFLIYQLFLIPIFGYLFKIKTNFHQKLSVLGIALLGLSSFLIAAIKFNSFTQIFKGFAEISVANQIDFRPQFNELFINYINRLAELFTTNFIPTNIFLGGLLAIFVLYTIRKNIYLLFCLLSNLPIFILGGHSNTYANIGLVVPAILATVIWLQNLVNNKKLFFTIIVFLMVISNLFTIFKNAPNGQIILVIPNDMNLKNELSLIDKTYQLAKGQPFSINTLTLPLWTNTTWAYLYSWYGKNKYGYLPFFYGHDQIGLLGVDSLRKIDKPLDKTFFIIEPHVGIPEDRYQLEIGSENSKTELIEQFEYRELKLQYRKPLTNE